MLLRLPPVACLVFLLCACAAPRAIEQGTVGENEFARDCETASAWQAGMSGEARDLRCEDGNYDEAFRLGSSLRGLQAEVAALQVQIDALGSEAAGAQIRQQRQRQIDIEALQGLARINGWEQDQ